MISTDRAPKNIPVNPPIANNNKKLIASDHRYDRTIHSLTDRQYKRNYIKHNMKI